MIGSWRAVGYHEGGTEPAEYDVTEFLLSGENLLAVQLVPFSARDTGPKELYRRLGPR